MLVQEGLFPDDGTSGRRTLPVIGEQKDIRYFGTTARGILNGPEVTGMGFWSVNPYVGCAFGCAYCYARYAHRYTAERLAAAAPLDAPVMQDLEALPPWLAFERRIFVKREAGAVVRRELRRPARIQALHRESVVIGTATDPVELLRVHPAGKKAMSAADWWRGRQHDASPRVDQESSR